ncbi:hypothetical protein Q2941_17415 [Bradyrhizobium sp. UFLA05-153]
MSKTPNNPNVISMIGETQEPTTEPLDPFAPENMRLPPEGAGVAPAEKPLLTVRVRKPPNQSWVRVHPDPAYHRDLCILEDKDEREVYYVPATVSEAMSDEAVDASVYLAIDRQGRVFLWPIKLPNRTTGKDNSWNVSAREAAQLAMRKWVRLKADMGNGGYDVWVATAEIPEPKWPKESMDEILKIAFKHYCIADEDHIIIQTLRRGGK